MVDAHAFDSTHSLQVQSIGRGIFGELAGGRCRRRGAAVHSARSSSARELIFYLLHARGRTEREAFHGGSSGDASR